MVLIECKNKEHKILSENSFENLVEVLEELTEMFEKKGIFFVGEEKIDKDTIVRDFATINNGYYCSLIICSGIVQNITCQLSWLEYLPWVVG